jgi:hypothetical protein
MSETNEGVIWASPEVREKNLEVYNRKKKDYLFWKDLMVKFVFIQIALYIPFIFIDFLPLKIAFWIANIGTFGIIAISEYHRRQFIKAGKGNW